MKIIHTEIDIHSNVQSVWNTLIKFEDYENWNPFITKIIGKPIVDTKIEIQINTKRGKKRIYHPTITKLVLNKELRWKGKSLLPGLFDGERIFLIEENAEGHVYFINKEVFTGLVTIAVGKKFVDHLRNSFNEMNNALKSKLESKNED